MERERAEGEKEGEEERGKEGESSAPTEGSWEYPLESLCSRRAAWWGLHLSCEPLGVLWA